MAYPSSMLLFGILAAVAAIASAGQPWAQPYRSAGLGLRQFSSLVAFGDSYTDDSRLGYFIAHDGQAPPAGWDQPVGYNSADGGRPWVQYVRQYANIDLYNYAVAGAVCSNDITPRYLPLIDADFPAVEQYEIPAWIADAAVTGADGSPFLHTPADATVYALWIGTNDLGVGAFLTDSQAAGTTLVNYTDCVFAQLERVYARGGRHFVLLNNVPLNLAPLYATPADGGVGPNHYWPDKPENHTAIAAKIAQEVALTNAIFEYELPVLADLAPKFRGARFALYDVHSLFENIYQNPTRYLNGTAPANVTGFVKHCNLDGTVCTLESSPDSYMWFDELHLSEQVARVVAREFVTVVTGSSQHATYLGGPGW